MPPATRLHLFTRSFLLLVFFSLSVLAHHHKRRSASLNSLQLDIFEGTDAVANPATVERRDAVSSTGYCTLQTLAYLPVNGVTTVGIDLRSDTPGAPWAQGNTTFSNGQITVYSQLPKSMTLSLDHLTIKGCGTGGASYQYGTAATDPKIKFCNDALTPPVSGGCTYYYNPASHFDWICKFPC